MDKVYAAELEYDNQVVEAEKRKQEEKIKAQQKYNDQVKQLQKELQQAEIETEKAVIADIMQMESDSRHSKLDADLNALDSAKDKELSNKNLTESQKDKINEKYAKKEAQLKLQGWEADKRAKLAQAAMNGALAITNIIANMIDPTPTQSFKTAAIILSAVTTASQLAVIANQQPPKFEKGGLIKGKLHKHGGTIIEAEDGEFVVNRKATAKHYNLLEQINKGMFVPALSMKEMDNIKYVTNHVSIDYDKLATTLAKKINDRPTSIINIDERGFEKRVVTLRSETSNKSKRYSFSA
jgi:hypothetical protein